MQSSMFLECGFTCVTFNGCDLANSEFTNTPLKKVDFRENNISDILLTGRELKDAIVSPMQAVELARLLGVIVK